MKELRSVREAKLCKNIRVVKLVRNEKGISNVRVFGGSFQIQELPEEIIPFRRGKLC